MPHETVYQQSEMHKNNTSYIFILQLITFRITTSKTRISLKLQSKDLSNGMRAKCNLFVKVVPYIGWLVSKSDIFYETSFNYIVIQLGWQVRLGAPVGSTDRGKLYGCMNLF